MARSRIFFSSTYIFYVMLLTAFVYWKLILILWPMKDFSFEFIGFALYRVAHKVLQSDGTQTIDHIQKCFRQKFQCSRRPSYTTTLFFYRWRRWNYDKVNSIFLNGIMYFFSMKLLAILGRIQRPTTQGYSSHAKYENS